MTRRRALLTCSLLALAVLFLVLLPYSFRYIDFVEVATVGRHTYALGTRQGSVFFVRDSFLGVRKRPSRWMHTPLRQPKPSVLPELPGRSFLGFRAHSNAGQSWLAIPLWLPAILLLLLAWRLRRWAPPPRGFCRHCGYDLRASPDRCPECGSMPPAQGC
jgi:hypothetical protein